MLLGNLGKCADSTGADAPLQVSGLVAELGAAGFAGKVWHACSFRLLAVPVASRRNACCKSGGNAQVDSVLPADRERPANLR
jgi:hypothetical protein